MEFSNDFFKKECRCGFEVSAMMKRAWAAELEVLAVVADVCERNHLQYFADWGTLLGAVRHKGFIPWDDDIDICLKRKDYDKLLQILPEELPTGFVVAGMYAKSKRLQDAAYTHQLRVIADETQWNFNAYMQRFHGFPYQRIGIDIYPMDNIPEDVEVAELQRNIVRQGIAILRNYDALEEAGQLAGYLAGYEEMCNVKIPEGVDVKNWMWRLVDSVCCLYEGENVTDITDFALCINSPTLSYRVKKEWYDDAIYVPFEHIEIPIPKGYDGILKVQFGDYMMPRNQASSHAYPFYGGMEKELEKQIRAVGFLGDVDDFCEKVSKGELYV